jgi:hypothetical protein
MQGIVTTPVLAERFGSAGADIVKPEREGHNSVHRTLGDNDTFVGEVQCSAERA